MSRFSHPFMRRRALPAVLPACLLAGMLLGSFPAAGQTREAPLSLRLVPKEIQLWGSGATQRFVLLGRYADGLERDLTAQADLSVSDSAVARLDREGKVAAVARGATTLTAGVAGMRAAAEIRVTATDETHPFSFDREIGGILTKKGCNANDCHGSVKGKGGFKLSANALYPKEDYQWIVQGGVYQVLSAEPAGERKPRIDLKNPEKSLLLAKATLALPHGGGAQLRPGSRDYLAILDWIRQGAVYGQEHEETAARIRSLEILPQSVALDSGGTSQLIVMARLSDGSREDLTGQVLYASNDSTVAEVSERGLVTGIQTGETAVVVRAAGQAGSTGVAVIADPIRDYPEIPRRNTIDEFVFAKLRRLNILPAELSSDEEFLRRVCLDLTGTLPPPQRVREFLDNPDPGKRDRLIEVLFNSPEYVDYWTFRLADLFRVAMRSTGTLKDTRMYWEWIRDAVARNRPYDQIARERIGAQGYDGPSRHYYHLGGELPTPANMMAEQLRVFLGRRLDCAQCHNHPYERWSQDQFWGLAAFFGRVSRIGQIGMEMIIIDDPAGHGQFGQGEKVIHPRTRQLVEPRFLDGRHLPEKQRTDLRMKLAQWVTAHPYFAEAAVNRLWSTFFGRGLVDPVDDFRLTNPPSHPGLLRALARDFREQGHNLKRLMRQVVQSRTYQLSGGTHPGNRKDRSNYSRALPRPLDAEVVLDAISQVTGISEDFLHWNPGREPPGTRAINVVWPDVVPSHFLELHGRPDRQMIPERRAEASLGQALHRLVGETYTRKLSAEGGRLDRLLRERASDGQVIEELYLAALSRFPAPREKQDLQRALAAAPSRREALEDLTWAMIAAPEFVSNH